MTEKLGDSNPIPWLPGQNGKLDRTYNGEHGEHVVEQRTASEEALYHFTIRAFSADQQRVSLSETRLDGSEPKKHDLVNLKDRSSKSMIQIIVRPKDLPGEITVLSGELANLNELPSSPQALVHVIYDKNGNFFYCELQAKKAIDISGSFDADNIQDITSIDDLIKPNKFKTYQRVLNLIDFGENGFGWEERERYNAADFQNSRLTIVQGAKSSYCEEIAIQNSKFIVTREENMITAVSTSANGEIRWVAKFPLKVDIDKIKEIFNDPNSDFRPLKTLVPASLKIEKHS